MACYFVFHRLGDEKWYSGYMKTCEHILEVQLKGYSMIAGVDEAGAGALAGPVVAGAVVLGEDHGIEGLADSKKLTEKKRDELYAEIISKSADWAFGMATVEEIIVLGIRPANYLAMKRAVEKLSSVDYVMVDAWTIPDLVLPQQGIIRGDQLVPEISAGSIIAKVTRDRIMTDLHALEPQYEFSKHKGYGTKEHRELIKKHGPGNFHRTNFTLT